MKASIEQPTATTTMRLAAEAITVAVETGIVAWTPESGSVTAADVACKVMDATAQAAAVADAPWLTQQQGLMEVWQGMATHAVEQSLKAAKAKCPQALRQEVADLRALVALLSERIPDDNTDG